MSDPASYDALLRYLAGYPMRPAKLDAPREAAPVQMHWCSCNGTRLPDGSPRPGCEGCNGTGYGETDDYDPHSSYGLSPSCLEFAEQLALELVGWRLKRRHAVAEAVRAGLDVPTWWAHVRARLAFCDVENAEIEVGKPEVAEDEKGSSEA